MGSVSVWAPDDLDCAMNSDRTTWADWLAAVVIGILIGVLAGAGF